MKDNFVGFGKGMEIYLTMHAEIRKDPDYFRISFLLGFFTYLYFKQKFHIYILQKLMLIISITF